MANKKKITKKNTNNINIILIGILVIVIGVCIFIFKKMKDNDYLNNVVDSFVCESGYYYKKSIVKSECVECEEGYYCVGDDERRPCPIAGTTTNGKGATTRYECK